MEYVLCTGSKELVDYLNHGPCSVTFLTRGMVIDAAAKWGVGPFWFCFWRHGVTQFGKDRK